MEKNEIFVIYGNNIVEMAIKLAEEANLARLIENCEPKDRTKKIGIKPNLVVSRPASEGATTHPEICLGLVKYLKSKGFNDLTILEGSWTGGSTDMAFTECGYTQFCSEEKVKLINTQKDRYRKYDCFGVEIEICDSAMGFDFMINVPVLKGHCQTLLTCALKNNKGLIPDREKRRFHTMGLHKPIAHLNTKLRNDFIIVDGICGDPDFEEGGNPVYGGRLIAARDPVLCDAWAAVQLGYAADEIPYIGIAEKLNIGIGDLKKAMVRELSSPAQSLQTIQSGKARRLARYIREKDACSACYASLISALLRLSAAELERIGEPVAIGQGFKGEKGAKGIGQCTCGFTSFCPGCPPSGAEVLAFLR